MTQLPSAKKPSRYVLIFLLVALFVAGFVVLLMLDVASGSLP